MTAVEWYEIEINSLIEKYESKEISKREFITMKHNLFYQAKEVEKQQIIDFTNSFINSHAFGDYDGNVQINKTVQQYYNETFNK